jgi:AraC-like DNA-binding protein
MRCGWNWPSPKLPGGRAAFGDVGRRLGFTVPPHFTRFFRDHAGATPREFRAVSRLDGGF